MPIWDPRFKYVPATSTDVEATWRRFGFRPTTDIERRRRLALGTGATTTPASPSGEHGARRSKSRGFRNEVQTQP